MAHPRTAGRTRSDPFGRDDIRLLSVFPATLRGLLPRLPFASLLSTTALASTGQPRTAALLASGAWAVALGGARGGATAARRGSVVQGG